MKFFVSALCLAWSAMLTVSAGFQYKAVTKDDQNNATEVESWIEGQNAKILFSESNNPMAESGSYIITTDGGKTIYLVNPKEKTYMKWDIQAMMKLAGGALNSMGGVLKMSFTDPRVTLLEEKDGGSIHGLATRYFSYKTTYDVEMKIIGIKKLQSMEITQKIWATTQVDDEAFGVWLRSGPPATGNEDLDKILAAEMDKVKGFPLKSITTTITRQMNKKGTKVKKETISNSETEVVSLQKNVDIDPNLFLIPTDYEEVEMPLGEDGGSPFKGLFNRDKQ